MGGATSIDKEYRQLGISWWPQEIPSHEEVENALTNIEKANNKVDFVFTHTAPTRIIRLLLKKHSGYNIPDVVEKIMDKISYILEFDQWYFGHYHTNGVFENKYSCLYQRIKKVIE